MATSACTPSSTAARVRWIVESDAGAPNTATCCAHSRSTSDRFTAPSTIPIAAPTSVTPRSRQPTAVLDGITADNAAVRPVRSAHARNNTAPACPTKFLPFPDMASRRSHPIVFGTEKVHLPCADLELDTQIIAGQRHLFLIYSKITG